MPMVTVIVPTFNRPEMLDQALRSISRQELRDLEVIVVNDAGRPPDTVIKRWKREMDVQLVNQRENGGPSRARNAGIDASRGTYLAFLDDDDVYLPGHLGAGVAALERGGADLVYTGIVLSSERVSALPEITERTRVMEYPFDPRFLLVGCYFTMSSIVCRNFKDRAVRFNVAHSACEDWELHLRLCFEERFRMEHVKQRTVIYHKASESGSLCSDATRSAEMNMRFVRAWREIARGYTDVDELVTVYRGYMTRFHDRCMEALKRGARLNPFYFEDFVSLLYSPFSRGHLIPEIDRRLDEILLSARAEDAPSAGVHGATTSALLRRA